MRLSYQDLIEVVRTQKDPAYLKRAKRELVAAREERKKTQKAKDDARARLKERESQKTKEKEQAAKKPEFKSSAGRRPGFVRPEPQLFTKKPATKSAGTGSDAKLAVKSMPKKVARDGFIFKEWIKISEGAAEEARRRSQMQKGMLKPDPRADRLEADRAAKKKADLSRDRAAADAAAKNVEKKVARDNRFKSERAAADANARKLEAKVKATPVSSKAPSQIKTMSRPANTVKKPQPTATPQQRAADTGAKAVKAKKGPSDAQLRSDGLALNNKLKQDRLRRNNKQRKQADKREAQGKARETVDDRASGLGGGAKKALGGDLIQRGKKSDSPEVKAEIRSRRRKAQADFSKKKVQQAGNVAKSAVGSAGRAMSKGPGENITGASSSSDLQGSTEIKRGQRS